MKARGRQILLRYARSAEVSTLVPRGALGRAPLLEVPDHALGDQALWTPPLVREALVDAFRLLNRTQGRVGPARLRAAWPEYFEAGDFPPEQTKTSPYHTRMTIQRMEMVLLGWRDEKGRDHPAWLSDPMLLAAPELRDKLRAWVFCELRKETDTMLCDRKSWALATFKRHRDRAAGIVARRLNSVPIEVW